MRYGLFGGTFDPVHLGHTTIAAAARESCRLDRVYFIPCRISPHKNDGTVASNAQRCRMIELAIDSFSWASLCTMELERPAPSYSWQTVAAFRQMHPGASFHWILGSDQWEVIESWNRADYLARSLTFLVFPRNGDALPRPRPGFRMEPVPVQHPANATAIRAARGRHPGFLDSKVARYIARQSLYA